MATIDHSLRNGVIEWAIFGTLVHALVHPRIDRDGDLRGAMELRRRCTGLENRQRDDTATATATPCVDTLVV